MDNPKFLKIVIIVLLLLNISTVAFMWMHKPPGPPFPPPPNGQLARDGQAPYRFLVNALKMDDRQQQRYAELRDEHHEAVQAIQQQNKDLHKRLYDLLQTNDTVQAQQLANSIADNQKQIELITFHHFAKVREICNPQQQLKFDSVINEALRMMAPPLQGGRPDNMRGERPNQPPPPPDDGNLPPPPPNN